MWRDQMGLSGGGDTAGMLTAGLPAGFWGLTVKCAVSWTNSSESDCAECQGPRAATVTVAFVTVGVKRIEWKDGDTWKEGPALVPITQSVQLRVIADPTGASFPPLQPEWSSNPNLPEMQIPGPDKSVAPQLPDLYTLTATAGGSSADITVIAYSIRMLFPHGDPTVSATDWNNHSSDAANEGNEITFKSHNTQPKCTLTCEAEILPAAAEAILAPKVTWTVDNVGTIAATWSSSVTGNSGIGQGKELTATYQSQNGLPPNNDDFGRKNVTLSFNGQAIDSSDFEVFYLKYENNHPGPNQVPEGALSSTRSKNWFYYWNQVCGDPHAFFNSKTKDTTGETPAMRKWNYQTQGPAYDKRETWYDTRAGESLQRMMGGPLTDGIDCFATCVRHELVHVSQIQRADALLGALNGQAGTIWERGWSWNKAINNHVTPGPDGRLGIARFDDNHNAIIDDGLRPIEFLNGKSEFLAPQSDDVDLDTNDDGRPDGWMLGIEEEAQAAETIENHTFWTSDWGNPGKQHQTNRKYDD